ncbi:MAG TPA: hypothetical protein VG652_02455 [Gaiellaceae bacterium]|nr:hypothetical protein [Gaiellaceae bacterium]
MPERRGFRFALEVLFLAALAAALSFGDLRPLVIAGLMLLGWLLVGLLEWVTWRDQAHYGRGLPPRYYVPQMALPEPRPVEQPWRSYPAPEEHEEARTWIAPRGVLADEVGAWPVARTPFEPASLEEPAPEFDPVQLLIPRAEVPVEEPAESIELTTALRPTSSSVRLERHRIDPLREPERSRLGRRRRNGADADIASVPARPEALRVRPLPPTRED